MSVYDTTAEKEGSLNNPVAGLTGWVVAADHPISGADVWFVHPWGNDFEYFVAPDPQYESLCSASNTGITPGTGKKDTEFYDATQHAQNVLKLPAPKGVIGVEIDQGLVPRSFQNVVTDGARIATFGRWIVDCGHDDFHTEIHPPLLTAVAKPEPPPAGVVGASQMTHVELMSRPFSTSQAFAEGNFVDHLLAEVAKVEDTTFGVPHSWRVEAHPHIFTPPYDGRPYIKLLVQPPVPRGHMGPVFQQQRLIVNFHFTCREGVAVRVFDAGHDTVGILIVLGDLNPSPLPRKHDLTVDWDELGGYYHWVIDALEIVDILTLNILPAVVLNRGILTDLYDPPQAVSPFDNQNVAQPVAIDALDAAAGISIDDSQPFPIYGWLKTYWQTSDLVVHPGPAIG